MSIENLNKEIDILLNIKANLEFKRCVYEKRIPFEFKTKNYYNKPIPFKMKGNASYNYLIKIDKKNDIIINQIQSKMRNRIRMIRDIKKKFEDFL